MNGDPVVLTGFMGSGKSTVAHLLADRLGWQAVDLDQEIVRREGRSIGEIFAHRGEAVFRRLERDALRESLGADRRVIALGGGALVSEENRRLVADRAVSFWLDPDFDTILARLGPEQRAERPLFQDLATARRLYRQRLEAYGRADHRIAVDRGETAAEVAARIERLMRDTGPREG